MLRISELYLNPLGGANRNYMYRVCVRILLLLLLLLLLYAWEKKYHAYEDYNFYIAHTLDKNV